MTRSNAREIAVQMIFSLGFGNLSADEVLNTQLTQERFQELAEDMPLYSQFPNEKQAQYIRDLVRGVFAHGPELDDYISRYAVGWSFSRMPQSAEKSENRIRQSITLCYYMSKWGLPKQTQVCMATESP